MQSDQRKLETDLAIIYDDIDQDPELLGLLGDENSTIKNALEDRDSKRGIIEANLWFQVENLRKINKELTEGAKLEERSSDLIDLVNDVLYFFGNLAKNYQSEYEMLTADSGSEFSKSLIFEEKNNLVKGFDIEQEITVDLDLMIGEDEMELIEEEEQKMVANYYYAFDLIKQRYQLEMQRLKDRDLDDPFNQRNSDTYQNSAMPKLVRDYFSHFKKLTVRLRRPRDELLELLSQIFDGLSKNEWEAYDSFWEHTKFQSLKKKAMLREFVREQKRLKAKTESLIAEHLRDKAKALILEDEHFKQKILIQELHERLDKQREQHNIVNIFFPNKKRNPRNLTDERRSNCR